MACVREHYGQIGEDAESRSLSFLNYNNTRNVSSHRKKGLPHPVWEEAARAVKPQDGGSVGRFPEPLPGARQRQLGVTSHGPRGGTAPSGCVFPADPLPWQFLNGDRACWPSRDRSSVRV